MTPKEQRPTIDFTDFQNKLEWEGGICGLAAYWRTHPPMKKTRGITDGMLDDLREKFAEIASSLEDFEALITECEMADEKEAE